MPEHSKKEEYNSIPVVFCSKCYSLNIQHEDAIDEDCCMKCGCTETRVASIEEWEELYERRYGHKLVTVSDNPRDSKFFKMSLTDLKGLLFKSKRMMEIIKAIYPKFPEWYSKVDTVIMFFDRLIRDHRIDDLCYVLYKYSKEDYQLKQ